MSPNWKEIAKQMEHQLKETGVAMVRLDGGELDLKKDTVDISPSHRHLDGKAGRKDLKAVFWEMRNEPRMKDRGTLLWATWSRTLDKTMVGTAQECEGLVLQKAGV